MVAKKKITAGDAKDHKISAVKKKSTPSVSSRKKTENLPSSEEKNGEQQNVSASKKVSLAVRPKKQTAEHWKRSQALSKKGMKKGVASE